MLQNIDDVLASALEQIEAGTLTLDDCLAQYPEHADELRRMVGTAHALQTIAHDSMAESAPRPEFKAAARERLLSKISAETNPSSSAAVSKAIPQARPQPAQKASWWSQLFGGTQGGFALRYGVLALIAILFVTTTTSFYAYSQSLPGETLYPVKTSIENARLDFAENTEADYIDLQLSYADARLDEIEQLVEQSAPAQITHTSQQYAEHMQASLLRIAGVEAGAKQSDYKILLDKAASNHSVRITTLEPAVAALATQENDAVKKPTIRAAKRAAENSIVFVETGAYSEDITRLSLMDVVRNGANFTKVYEGLKAESLQDMLTVNGPFTVLVPTDEAIAQMPAAWEDAMRDNKLRRHTMLYHIIQGEYDNAAFRELTSIKTALGSDISIALVDGEIVLNGIARLIPTDIKTDNGIIHYIDVALIPPVQP